MSHIIVKMVSGKSEAEKFRIAEEITKAIINAVQSEEKNISVGIQEVQKEHWMNEVYQKEIVPEWDTLYKKPAY